VWRSEGVGSSVKRERVSLSELGATRLLLTTAVPHTSRSGKKLSTTELVPIALSPLNKTSPSNSKCAQAHLRPQVLRAPQIDCRQPRGEEVLQVPADEGVPLAVAQHKVGGLQSWCAHGGVEKGWRGWIVGDVANQLLCTHAFSGPTASRMHACCRMQPQQLDKRCAPSSPARPHLDVSMQHVDRVARPHHLEHLVRNQRHRALRHHAPVLVDWFGCICWGRDQLLRAAAAAAAAAAAVWLHGASWCMGCMLPRLQANGSAAGIYITPHPHPPRALTSLSF